MNNGWITLHRKLLDNPISNKSDYLSLWVHLLLMANHTETHFIWNNKKQTLNAGQILTGRKKLSKKTGIAESQIYKILNYLELEQQIEQQKTTKYTVITIVNWNKYQDKEQQKEQQSNNRVTTKEQQSNTYNNVNNDNNVNNISKDIELNSSAETPKVKKEPDKRISELMEYLKSKVGGQLDGTEQVNRRYCYSLINRLYKAYPDYNTVDQIKILIDKGLEDPFHSQNLTSFKYLFYNYVKMVQKLKQNSNLIYKV